MPRSTTLLLVLAMVAAATPGAVAGDPPARDHDITIDDYFTQSYISTIATSPDGRHVAYVEGRWDKELDRRNMDLWVVEIDSKQVRRLTFDPASDGSPSWSPDGKWIYFRASRKRGGDEPAPYNGKAQVWRVAVDGGAIVPVTRLPDSVDAYALSASGHTLYYTVSSKQTDEDQWGALRKEFDDLEYGHGVVEYSELWALDLRTWRSEKLVDERRVIGAFAVTDDERRIAMVTTPTAELIVNEGWSEVDVYERGTGKILRVDSALWREAAPSPYGWIVGPTWSSDGNRLALRVDFDGYPGELFVAHFDGRDAQVMKLTRPGEVSVEGQMKWVPGTDDLCFIAEDHARARLYRISGITADATGTPATMTPGDVVLQGFSISADAFTVAVLKAGLDHTPDIFVLRPPSMDDPDQAPRFVRITSINPQVNTWKLPQIQIVRWTSPDGTPVEGILELPHDFKTGDGPLPTLVSIHGGPTSSSKYQFRYWIYGHTLYSSRGWAVFDPNYRGSTGYGDKFLTDLIENKNNLDVQDILAGVDKLVELGIADPDRLAVMGWSNGGYLTNCLITATDRFKAASSGAGVFDTVMQWSIEDTPGHVINYSGGLPWERAKKMHETSPLYSVDKVVTPTVIHVGENDERVPVEHSRSLHRALHHYLDVPSELVVYPGTGHGLRKLTHRQAKLKWDLKWLEYYVLGHSEEDAVPE
ncbi:MAG: S9 family peptidase [Planctomycetes bacterium]|nr:S9 family peptidase [Planctomycetota bacterium]